MASNDDEGPVVDTAMEHDEDTAQGKVEDAKPTYKSFKYVLFTLASSSIPARANQQIADSISESFSNSANMATIRKKYRKMRIKFDDVMTKSNDFFKQERKALETAKRLKQQNE
jgi:hypothetical protein